MSCAKWLFQYPNDILVETGTGGGGGVQFALKYGFKEVYSIEIDKAKYDYCVGLFKNNKNVYLYCGDSVEILPQILSKIKTKATFLLDAHVSDAKQVHGSFICPVLEELKTIVSHSKNLGVRHSILVDDANFFSGSFAPFGNIKISDIKKAITDIDSSYVITVGKRSLSIV